MRRDLRVFSIARKSDLRGPIVNRRTVAATAVAITAVTALAACGSSGGSGSSASPSSSASSASASPSGQTITKTVGDWEIKLNGGGSLPAGWPSSIPAPAGGNLTASGTAEPKSTTSDHKTLAVEYMAPGAVNAVSAAQTAQMKANGWTFDSKGSKTVLSFLKGNDSAFIGVVPNGSTGGVTVYQWT